MKELEYKGQTYRIDDMSPHDAFHLSRRVGPFIPAIAPILEGLTSENSDALAVAKASGPFAEVMAKMSDSEADEIIFRALSVVLRKGEKDWGRVMRTMGILAYEDLNMVDMVFLAVQSLKENLGPFLQELHTSAPT